MGTGYEYNGKLRDMIVEAIKGKVLEIGNGTAWLGEAADSVLTLLPSCLRSIEPGEPVFVLRGCDRLAPDLVYDWCRGARGHGVPSAKIDEAEKLADAMIDYQEENPNRVRVPD